MKEFKDWTFDDLVLHCSEIILNHLLDGKLKTGIYIACSIAIRWQSENNEQKKENLNENHN